MDCYPKDFQARKCPAEMIQVDLEHLDPFLMGDARDCPFCKNQLVLLGKSNLFGLHSKVQPILVKKTSGQNCVVRDVVRFFQREKEQRQ